MPIRIPPSLSALIEEHRKRLDTLITQKAVNPMLAALQAARADLAGRLRFARGPYTLTQHRMYLALLDDAIVHLSRGVAGTLDAAQLAAKERAVSDAFRKAAVAAREFGGIDIPMPLTEALRLVRGDSKLREVEQRRSKRAAMRYGMDVVDSIERDLTTSLMTGETTDQATARLFARGTWDDARWKAERVARTETAWAYNSAAESTLSEVAADDPDLWLMWHEHASGPTWGGPKDKPSPGPAAPLDNRVGADSLRMHGQLRRPGEAFVDPLTGRQYDHPPNRPNDRATLILVRVDKAGRLAA